jgi:sigma-B regulation protein RsbU (phosphoserine phosphatase)
MNHFEVNNSTSILVVDDNPKNLQVLGGLLQKERMDVEFALDGKTALSWLDKRSFDLVLLDIMMPGMDGFEVCSIIKENPVYKDVPVVFITAKTDSESIIKGFEIGGVDYITKPFIPSELIARVRTQVHIKKSKEKIISYLNEIELRNRNIRDSIEYAGNIQKAVLNTSLSKIGSYPESFILYLPKDILSGDFYWYYKMDDNFILAVMDCTGHGVPGALMSILGMTLLNEIVLHDRIFRSDKILENLRTKIINPLGQDQEKMRIKDGIEGAIIDFNQRTMKLNFSGAFNPLLYNHNHEMVVIRADRIPIGYYEKEQKFTLKTINIEKGDIIYLFSDGYIDQFGGSEKRKIMSKGLTDLLQKIHNLPMADQKTELFDFVSLWRGDMEQTDDILVVGIRF